MFKKYLLSSVAFDKANDAGAKPLTPRELAAQQRAAIEVTRIEGDAKKVEAAAEENAEAGEEVAENEEVEEVAAAAETDDEKTEVDEPEKDPAILKLEKQISRLQKRIDKQTGAHTELGRQLAEAQAALAAKEATAEDKPLTAEDIQREAERIANAKIADKEFTAICNKLADDATKIEKDFDKKIAELKEEVSPLPGAMIGMLDDLENGGAVLAYFVNNHDDYEDIYKLSIPKMALRLLKLSEKLLAASKPKPKAVSQVPAPNKTLDGSNRNTNNIPLTAIKDDKEWMRARERDIANKRAAGRLSLR